MRSISLTITLLLICFICLGARSHVGKANVFKNKEVEFLALKYKKDLNDKKLSPLKKYTFAILAAREFKQLKQFKQSIEFYQIANKFKSSENDTEISLALSSKESVKSSPFFYQTNLKKLIQKKMYEKAILSINPDTLNNNEFAKYRIIYDLLNVKIKKQMVKNLYCIGELQKNPEDYQYSNVLCDLLVDYLRDGKFENNHLIIIEASFLKQDLDQMYLLEMAKDMQNNY
jgi:hypothetical protein